MHENLQQIELVSILYIRSGKGIRKLFEVEYIKDLYIILDLLYLRNI